MYKSFVYRKSPAFVQSVILSLYGLLKLLIRQNESVSDFQKVLESHEYDQSKLDSYIKGKREEVVSNALKNVPYYKGNHSKPIQFPLLTKSDVREHKEMFLNDNQVGPVVKGSTSGTTGTPLEIPQSIDSVRKERAFANRQRAWAGFKKGDKRAWIRGDLVVPIEDSCKPFWRYSWFERMLVMSSFHLSQNNISLYLDEMEKYGVDIIQAYPSSITTIAKYLKSNGQFYKGKLKSIITSSELLTKEDREVIEERFQCKVFDWYGQFERVAAIANCEHGRYHILTDYSDVELVPDENGNIEIVGTNFNNLHLPLIRYRTGDHVTLSSEQSCPCGRVYPIVESIDGRKVDYIFNSKKEKVFALDQCVKGVSGVLGSQYIQKEHGKISVHVVCDDQFGSEQESKLIENVKDRLGRDIVVETVQVESLIRTKNGKVKQAICLVEEDQ